MIEDVERLTIYILNQASTIKQIPIPAPEMYFSSGLIILKYLKVGSQKAGKENDP